MSMRGFLGALCVFLALLASPVLFGPAQAWQIVPSAIGETGPRVKPDRTRAATLPDGVSIVRQCAASTMMAKVVDAAGNRVFYARYSRTAFDEMVAAGCTVIQQGCNTCQIGYTGCSDLERAACKDAACLAQVCKRRMICTSKRCTAESQIVPSCDARFARHTCLASAFVPLDKIGPRE